MDQLRDSKHFPSPRDPHCPNEISLSTVMDLAATGSSLEVLQQRLQDHPPRAWHSMSLHRSMVCGSPQTKPPRATSEQVSDSETVSSHEGILTSSKPNFMVAGMCEEYLSSQCLQQTLWATELHSPDKHRQTLLSEPQKPALELEPQCHHRAQQRVNFGVLFFLFVLALI